MTTVSVSRQLTQRVNDAFQTHCRQTQPDIITSILNYTWFSFSKHNL